jgi:hypothetical protein
MLFQHGYALIVGVGRPAYPAWSLPPTAGAGGIAIGQVGGRVAIAQPRRMEAP